MNASVNRPSALTPMPTGGSSRGDQGGLVVVFLVLLFATFLFSANSSSGQRNAIAGVASLTLFPLLWFAPRTGMPVALVFLMTLGGFRRGLIPIFGYTEFDPLLLVSPVIATICFVNFAIKRQLKPTTQLSKWVLAFMLLMGISVLNPLQGGPLVGLTGAAFYLVPLMWYCIGRQFGTPGTVKAIMQVTLTVSILGALLGLKQHFFGFSDAEKEWFYLSHFTNQVGGTERAMSFYTSPAEYANFLSLGVIICFCSFLRGQRGFLLIALFLAYAMFMTGIRGIVICCVGACTLMWAVQGQTIRGWIPRIVIALIVVGVGGVFGLLQIGSAAETIGGGASGAEMVNHQIEGLTNPLKKGSSTQGHLGNIGTAIVEGIKMPIGYGLGSSTMGSTRFGGSASFNAETDVATILYAMGLIGGIAFIGTIVVCFRALGLYWYHTRTYIPLVVMGALVSSNGNWLTPGNYAQSVFVWMLIGCLDRTWNDGRNIPGLIEKMKRASGSINIWKNTLAKRLKGTNPSWEAAYLRAGQSGASPSGPTLVPSLNTEAASIRQTATSRLTPSAKRALERSTQVDEGSSPKELREQL